MTLQEQAVTSGENDLVTAGPQMAKLWHPTKNGDLKPTEISSGSRKRVWWQCGRGHSWQAPPYSIKGGTSCPYCFGRLAIFGETDLATTHPHLLGSWSSRNTLSPTAVTAGSHKRVWWVCGKGHEWESSVVSYVLGGCGCPYCAGKRAIPGETDLATLRPDLMEEWDAERNALDPGQITVGSHDKVWWRCKLGHSWQAAVFSRTRENTAGCPYCTGRMVLPGFNDLATLMPKLAEQWYQPLNGALKPEDVTLGSNKKVWWQCSEGHVWQAFIYARAKRNGTGCPVCAGSVKRRKGAEAETARPQKKAQSRKKNEPLAGVNAQI
ncbi:MAG: zinc-ribbon domain-containing protein [Oscillospiraceae bacterium]|nr:zinc-ribbon domain-containing protein [Oscillospiraceae bacterium]